MPTLLNCEQELQRALEVIAQQSRTIEMLTALLAQHDDDADDAPSGGYLSSRG